MNASTTARENITFEQAVGKLQKRVSSRVLPWSPDIYGEPEEILTVLKEIGIGTEKLWLDVLEMS